MVGSDKSLVFQRGSCTDSSVSGVWVPKCVPRRWDPHGCPEEERLTADGEVILTDFLAESEKHLCSEENHKCPVGLVWMMLSGRSGT